MERRRERPGSQLVLVQDALGVAVERIAQQHRGEDPAGLVGVLLVRLRVTQDHLRAEQLRAVA